MPLLEIIQTRQISASIRLDEATATQVDQYAAFIHATADDVVDKALNYVFSKDRVMASATRRVFESGNCGATAASAVATISGPISVLASSGSPMRT